MDPRFVIDKLASEVQAINRIYRIGQTRKVSVLRLFWRLGYDFSMSCGLLQYLQITDIKS